MTTKVLEGKIKLEDINEDYFGSIICMSDLPEVELIIRTGGEFRISNFLLWQSAYAELYFTDTLWPDFNPISLDEAINTFNTRERRFGSVQNEELSC